MLPPINFPKWIEDNKHLLKPPVGVKQIWNDTDFIVSVVGAPNQRTDFHDDPYEEYFWQFKGDAYLIVHDRGKFDRVDLNEGAMFLLPPHMRHSPQRPQEGSLCLLIERMRPKDVLDAFEWYCAECANRVIRIEMHTANLADDLPKAFERFYTSTEAERRCSQCATVHPGRDWNAWHQAHNRRAVAAA